MVGILEKKLREEVKQFEGSYAGAQFKPAVEVVLMVMKPLSEKTFVDQALKNGKGCTWLDSGRIPFQDSQDIGDTTRFNGLKKFPNEVYAQDSYTKNMLSGEMNVEKGRFPANLLVEDDVLNDGLKHKSGTIEPHHVIDTPTTREIYNSFKTRIEPKNQITYGDSGSYSRYFSLDAWFETTFPFIITPKPSQRERNMGLDKWMPEKVNDGRQAPIDNPFQRGETLRKNTHPTVKPIKLFSYLISLVSRPGDVVLDPFIGTGTTAIAARMLKRKWIGIELSEEYVKIANARINSSVL